MSHQRLSMSLIVACLLTFLSLCQTDASLLSVGEDEAAAAVQGENQILQNALDEIVQQRRQHVVQNQVVRPTFQWKYNRSISEFSQAEKDYLLLVHNAYRSAVQPFAASMLEVVWDDKIAAFAQDWANQCTASHRSNRKLGKWRNMGENIYWAYSGRYHEGLATKFWWDEVRWYNFTTNKCAPRRMCGHYKTMTWARTERIGCGINRCHRLIRLPHIQREAYYFVCNYSGRFISNVRPYDRAHNTICSHCYRTHARKCRYNLCVTQDMLDNDIGYNGSTAEIGFNRIKTFTSRKSRIRP